jgi:hypothetical protein
MEATDGAIDAPTLFTVIVAAALAEHPLAEVTVTV